MITAFGALSTATKGLTKSNNEMKFVVKNNDKASKTISEAFNKAASLKKKHEAHQEHIKHCSACKSTEDKKDEGIEVE